jgi:hypothetical protein
VSVAGAVNVWVAAPPSDHATNAYVTPFSVCGDGAVTETVAFTISVFTNGVSDSVAPAVNARPAGSLAKVRSTVSG